MTELQWGGQKYKGIINDNFARLKREAVFHIESTSKILIGQMKEKKTHLDRSWQFSQLRGHKVPKRLEKRKKREREEK